MWAGTVSQCANKELTGSVEGEEEPIREPQEGTGERQGWIGKQTELAFGESTSREVEGSRGEPIGSEDMVGTDWASLQRVVARVRLLLCRCGGQYPIFLSHTV